MTEDDQSSMPESSSDSTVIPIRALLAGLLFILGTIILWFPDLLGISSSKYQVRIGLVTLALAVMASMAVLRSYLDSSADDDGETT